MEMKEKMQRMETGASGGGTSKPAIVVQKPRVSTLTQKAGDGGGSVCRFFLLISVVLLVLLTGHLAYYSYVKPVIDAKSKAQTSDTGSSVSALSSVLHYMQSLLSSTSASGQPQKAQASNLKSAVRGNSQKQSLGSKSHTDLHFVHHDDVQGQGRHQGQSHPFDLHLGGQAGRKRKLATCVIPVSDRFDCFPDKLDPTPSLCEGRGCCYDNSPESGAPPCFFSTSYDGYKVMAISPITRGSSVVGYNATLHRSTTSAFPNDVMTLRLLVWYETKTRARFTLFDPATDRYEVPIELNDYSPPIEMDSADYLIGFEFDPFFITIIRKSNGQILFDTRNMAPLIFADQYIQISSSLSSNMIFGLGEHRSSFLLNTDWQKMVFWARDQPPVEHSNLYGSHPFYMNLEPGGNAHGVFLLNSNGMQVDLQPHNQTGAITYRALGGILDFFVFLGPTPDEVVKQYVNLIGLPFMPPFWALGFHLCRHGYDNSSNFWNVIQRNRAANIPYDVQWNDLDYSAGNKIWTWDSVMYKGLPDILRNLHDHGQHNIIIVDPVVSSNQPAGTYAAWDRGVQLDVFIKNATGQILLGQLWPGPVAFVDFFHHNTFDYWLDMIMHFHEVLAFDGLWIDMNEPSDFSNGSIAGCVASSSLDHPPFLPQGIFWGTLYGKTICPSAMHDISSHYNLHNLYGWGEMIVTMQNLQVMYGKRTLVISRSTAPGSGKFGGHWTGDNFSTFKDLYFSIPAILNFNLFGMPFVGADICGFNGDTNRELCIRWMQLGSFYSFTRNHAEYRTVEQDPGSWDSAAQKIMGSALRKRYSLLPYLYTLLFAAHTTGSPVLRPLFFDYPGTEKIDRQFLWGHDLLISPVLEEGAQTVEAYIPKGTWYDLDDLTLLKVTGSGMHTLPAPLEKINAHVRGGSILPMLQPALTTTLLRQGKMELLVALDPVSQSGSGHLYWDDGDTLEPALQQTYTSVGFKLNQTTLTSSVRMKNYRPVTLGTVNVLGVERAPANVTLNGKAINFTFDSSKMVLTVGDLSVDLLTPFILTWHW